MSGCKFVARQYEWRRLLVAAMARRDALKVGELEADGNRADKQNSLRETCGCNECSSWCFCDSWPLYSLSFVMHAGCRNTSVQSRHWVTFYQELSGWSSHGCQYSHDIEIRIQGALSAGHPRQALHILRTAIKLRTVTPDITMRALAHLGRRPCWYARVLRLATMLDDPFLVVSLPDLALRQHPRSTRLLFARAPGCAETWRQLACSGAFPRFENLHSRCLFARRITIRLACAYQNELTEETLRYARGLGCNIFDAPIPFGTPYGYSHIRRN